MKKKEIIILISILVLTIIAIILTTVIFITKNNDKTNKNLDNTFVTLFNNNYKYYYYMFGDIEVGDGYIVIDDTTYYSVIDENVLKIDEFNNVLNKTFVKDMIGNLLNKEDYNEYIEIDSNLYVKKSENVCKNIKEFNFDNLNYLYNDEKIEVKFDSTSTYIYNEDGDWKLGTNIYFCLD